MDNSSKEYEILEEALGAANTAAYAVAGIFMGGLLIASARLIPEIARRNCESPLDANVFASFIILLCTWFWFFGIHLRWRANNAIMYQRLLELERSLPFRAHRRIAYSYNPKCEQPPWYETLLKRLGPLRPWRPGMNCWWFAIVLTITAAYIITWLFAIHSCVWSFLQCLSGSIL